MTKIFSADYRKGSFIDSVNKIVGVPTSLSKLIRTEKGTALARVVNHNGVTYTTGSKSLSKFTIVAWIKQRTTDTGERYGIAVIGSEQIIRRNLSATDYNNYFNNSTRGTLSVPTSTSLNKWMQFVVTYDGANVVSSVNNKQIVGSPSETTATLDFTSITIGRGTSTSRYSDSDILKFEVYDDVISDKAIELDYRDLLESQPTEKPVRGFELVKPTDLSYLKDRGLLAAYNFKRNGDTLVDISGNGNNGTITGGGINTKDGLGFNGVKGYIGCGNAFGYDAEMTILGVISPNYTSRINIIGKDNSVLTKRGFYVDLLNTGRLRFLFSQTGSTIQYYDSVTSLGNNQKNTFAITFKGGVNSKIYINGALDKTEATALTSIFNNSLDFNIGFNVGVSNYFNGEIQDIRVYNRELTEQEIKDYHNSFIKPVILEDWSGSAVSDVI